MALKDPKVKNVDDVSNDVRRKVSYLLKTMADTLNSISDSTKSFPRNDLLASLGTDSSEAQLFHAEMRAICLKYDPSLTIKAL